MVQNDLLKLLELLGQDLRRRLLIYLNEKKKVAYRKLGISPSYLFKLKQGKREYQINSS